jgi:hypothetical protein
MALPKITLPIMELTLPSTGEQIKYRPFTVKEEKILLIAQESGDPTQEILAAKQIVSNCLINRDASNLPMFDLEYILLTLRSASVNNVISFQVRDPDTNEQVPVEIDINKITVQRSEGHTNEVKINDEYTLFLKYPTIEEFIKLTTMDPEDPLTDYFMLCSCIDKVASDDEVHEFKEYDQEAIDSFMDSLSGEVIKSISKFFETMPRLKHEITYTNNEGNEKTFVVEGMRSFFL